ncbi:MAG: D-alanyl-D-alanine carboxypeptidase [Alphaproteobacteria bacterium]|nr:D-alanyl-D-alanine carboxypeptidase [Alphaproteobacteria bacterium]MBV8549426.1 D-alanyl-D-alanine carboxypeptidase [Alphaproteobacteria bacterium]
MMFRFLALILACQLVFTAHAMAQTATVPPVETAARQAFLLDVNTNTPLFAKDADTQMPTSSMSKMLTMYLVFEAIRDGKLSLDSMVPVSEHAWRQEGSRMFLNVGQQAKAEDLIRGVIVQSGNDAAVTLAEAVAGSEESFAELMNTKAHQLGMNNSHFMNATGMPDPQHYSTARDLAILALALIRDFPERYHYFSELEFTYNGIKQGNRNPLLYRAMQVDGLKTGHTDVGGFGLTASALRNGRRLVLVLNGMTDMQARADESAHVLDWGYREFGYYPAAKAGEKVATAKTWLGVQPEVDLVAADDLAATLPRGARSGLKASYSFDQPIAAPIKKGQVVGSMTLSAPGMEDRKVDLVAANDVAEKGFFARIASKLGLLFGNGA